MALQIENGKVAVCGSMHIDTSSSEVRNERKLKHPSTLKKQTKQNIVRKYIYLLNIDLKMPFWQTLAWEINCSNTRKTHLVLSTFY